MSINEKVTSNKIRDIEIKTKLNDLEKKLISTKGLTVGLINKYSILNGAKYFSMDRLQNYLVFLTFRKYVFIFETNKIMIFLHGNLQDCQKEKIINPYDSDTIFSPELNISKESV